MLAPSVSVNKVATQNPSNEVDHLFYRLGGVARWLVAEEGLTEIQARAAFVYDTDTRHRASLPAFEFDLEPRFLWTWRPDAADAERFKHSWAGIGYRTVL